MSSNSTIVIGLGAVIAAGAATWWYLNRAPSADSGSVGETLLDTLDEVTVTASKLVGSAWPYPRGQEYQSTFEAVEQANDIPAGLLSRQGFQESRFRQDIIDGSTVSSAGAVGIMQIVPRWHPDVNAYDPIASINYAGQFLRKLYDKFNSWDLALASYNWGAGNVAKYPDDRSKWPKETQNYVAQITADVQGLA